MNWGNYPYNYTCNIISVWFRYNFFPNIFGGLHDLFLVFINFCFVFKTVLIVCRSWSWSLFVASVFLSCFFFLPIYQHRFCIYPWNSSFWSIILAIKWKYQYENSHFYSKSKYIFYTETTDHVKRKRLVNRCVWILN